MIDEPKFKVGDTVLLDYGDEEQYAKEVYGSEGANGEIYKIVEVRISVDTVPPYTYRLLGTNYHLEKWLRHPSKIRVGGEKM